MDTSYSTWCMAIRQSLHNSAFENILFNIVGGLLTVPVAALFARVWQRLSRRRFQKIFGPGSKSFVLVYGSLSISGQPPVGKTFQLEKKTVPEFRYSAEQVSNVCEMRAAAYVSAALSKSGAVDTTMRGDEEIKEKLDLDFISLGAMNNLKTIDLLNNESNRFVEFSRGLLAFVAKGTKTRVYENAPGFEHAVILRIHPKQFPHRTWICCAGDGEWGTSGCAWYLSRNWKKLAKELAGDEEFLAVLRVRVGQDESSELLHMRSARTNS